MVGDTRFDLVTPSMSTKCSTTELITHDTVAGLCPSNDEGRGIPRRSVVYKRSREQDQGLLANRFIALCYGHNKDKSCPRTPIT